MYITLQKFIHKNTNIIIRSYEGLNQQVLSVSRWNRIQEQVCTGHRFHGFKTCGDHACFGPLMNHRCLADDRGRTSVSLIEERLNRLFVKKTRRK